MGLPLLEKFNGILVPVRGNGAADCLPSGLAFNLNRVGSSHYSEDAEFFEFFADILFLNSDSEDKRTGISRAFKGLEEILSAAADVLNAPLLFREDVLASLKRFEAALKDHEAQNGRLKYFQDQPEKQNNLITYYLSEVRKSFLPSELMSSLFGSLKQSNLPLSRLKALREELKNKKNLILIEPTARQLIELIETQLKSPAGIEIEAQIRALGRQTILEMEDRWRKLCLVGYRGTRNGAETSGPDSDRGEKIAWVVRTALGFVTSESIEREDVLINLPGGTVSDATRLCFESRKYASKSIDTIGRISWFVAQGKIYPWKRKWRRKMTKSAVDFGKTISVKRTLTPSEELENAEQWKDEIAIHTDEGGAPDELFDRNEPTVKGSPAGSSSESKAFRLTFDEPSWGKSQLTDETLGVVWSWLIEESRKNPADAQLQHLVFFVELLIHYGFQVRQLLKAKFFPALAITESTANITFNEDRILICPKRTGQAAAFAAPRANAKDFYLPSSNCFSLPLPPALALRAKASRQISDRADGDSFFAGQSENVKSAKSAAKTASGYNKLLKPLNDLLNEKITIEKIARSARTLLREAGDLNNLEIALLSSEVPRRTASPMFYTNIEIPAFVRRCRQAVNKNLKTVAAGSGDYARHLNLPPLAEENFGTISGAFPEEEIICVSGEEEGKVFKLGSPFVPRPKKFADYLNSLKIAVGNRKNFIVDHNRKTALAALTLMSLTGLRPLELFFITAAEISLDDDNKRNSLTVIAKINQKHSEWRHLPLSSAAAEVLRDYQAVSATTRNHIHLTSKILDRQIEARLGDGVFFFLRRTYAPVRLSTRGLAALLRDDSYLDYRFFPWKLNAPRHLYRTTAYEMRVPEKILNYLMGHQTTGLEEIGQFSAADYNEAVRYAALISERIREILEI